MYDDYFPEIKIVKFKFRPKVSTEEKFDEKYNSTYFGNKFKAGFTGQIYGHLSNKGKTLADYKELGIILDKFSSNNKGWNSGFRVFCEDFDKLAYLQAKYMLLERQ